MVVFHQLDFDYNTRNIEVLSSKHITKINSREKERKKKNI